MKDLLDFLRATTHKDWISWDYYTETRSQTTALSATAGTRLCSRNDNNTFQQSYTVVPTSTIAHTLCQGECESCGYPSTPQYTAVCVYILWKARYMLTD